MNKITKRLLSLVLCLCMLMSIPVISFAADVGKVASIKVTDFTASKVEFQVTTHMLRTWWEGYSHLQFSLKCIKQIWMGRI